MDFYHSVLGCLHTQNYHMLYPTDLVSYHYIWWKPGKYKQLKMDQLNRHPQYHLDFGRALDEVRKAGSNNIGDVVLRPTMDVNRMTRYVAYLDIDHPKHIKEHENFVK